MDQESGRPDHRCKIQIRGSKRMFEMFSINMKHIYPVLVVSTMSSGKSTLINALLGKDLLPSRNTACTVRAAAVLNNDAREQFGIHVVDEEGKYCFVEQDTEKAVADYNQSNNIDEIIIEGNIQGIRSSQKAFMLIDTPGINYCLDPLHEKVTREVLDEYQKGMILYVINATQMATSDDSNSLNLVARKIKDNPDFKVIFVINKMDKIDPEKEDPCELVENCREYVRRSGIEDPILIPVSAESALIFQKALNKEPLSQMEKEDFARNYTRFKRDGYSLVDYASIPGCRNGKETLTVGGKEYTCAGICAALENTGVPLLKKKIDEALTASLKVEAPEIKVKKSAERKRISEAQKAAEASRQEKRDEMKKEQEKKEREKKEQERREKERIEKEKKEQEKRERERLEREKKERKEQEKREKERLEKEKKERKEQEKRERERTEREKKERKEQEKREKKV